MGNLIEVAQVTDDYVVTVNRRGVFIHPLPGRSPAGVITLPVSFLGKVSQVISNLAIEMESHDQVEKIVEKFVPFGHNKKKNLFVAGVTLGKNLAKRK